MNSDYEKAKRIFQGLRKRLHDGTSIDRPDSEKHLEVVKRAVRDQFLKEKSAAGIKPGKQRRNEPQKMPSLLKGKAKKEQPAVLEIGIYQAGVGSKLGSDVVSGMLAKHLSKSEINPPAPKIRRIIRRKNKKTKHSNA